MSASTTHQITLHAQELAALREVLTYLDDEIEDFELRGKPQEHIGYWLLKLAAAVERHDLDCQVESFKFRVGEKHERKTGCTMQDTGCGKGEKP